MSRMRSIEVVVVVVPLVELELMVWVGSSPILMVPVVGPVSLRVLKMSCGKVDQKVST